MDREIILFKADDIELQVKITPDEETVWLTQDQMAELFDKDRSVIGRHSRKANWKKILPCKFCTEVIWKIIVHRSITI